MPAMSPQRRAASTRRTALCAAIVVLCWAPFAVLADPLDSGSGLRVDQAAWSRWQGRLGLVSDNASAAGYDGRSNLQTLTALGDYYFSQQGTDPGSRYGGGFRASGGVLVGARNGWSVTPSSVSALSGGFYSERRSVPLWGAPTTPDTGDANAVVPYLGVGYTGLRSLTGTGGGWGFSADVGVMALSPRAAVRLGAQNSGEALHDFQLSPMLQLGVSYSF